MAYQLPNGSTFDAAATYKTDINEATISNGKPAVVTAAAHDLTDGDYVLLVNSSWTKLNNRVFRVAEVDGDTFELEGTDTTNLTQYPVGGKTTVRGVATWVQIPQILSVDFSGGEQQFYNFQFLEDDDERQMPTNKSASSLTLEVADDPEQAFVPIIEGYDELKEVHAFKLNLVNGDSIAYPAVPSITSTPTMGVNELMSRTVTLAMQGRINRYTKLV